ncbi:MAG: family 20 glycosylhydrolase [Alistipes sp.]|nr:family 20 glycosylhydrolase [Alistipes sp.]
MKLLKFSLHILLAMILSLGAKVCMAADGVIPPTIYPQPAECIISSTDYVPLTNIVIASQDNSAIKWAEKHLKEWYGKYAPKVTKSATAQTTSLGEEGYSLQIDHSGVTINANTIQGVRYALYSLRQIAIPQRGSLQVGGWIAPVGTINDKPQIEFRGVHICWFRETEPWEVERLIRLAAYYKMNYAVIESWGTFQSDIAPWSCWPDGTMTKREIKRLKAIADDLGITLIPQINVFGHAAQARGYAGKHSTLDINPKYQPLFEPLGGWNWCLSNPETRKLLQALIKERYEAFGCPPYFHIGCDEAHQPSCPDCASKPYSQLFLEHIEAMNKTITSLGARTMMWHDMLIEQGDSRWQGFVVNGTRETAAGILKLPRDIIICDWYYGGAQSAYPTIDYFKEQGFSVLSCPWNNSNGIIAQSRNAHKSGIMGVLGTMWHHYFGASLPNIYYTLANAMWNPEANISTSVYDDIRQRVHTHIRQIGWDMKLRNPRHGGTYYEEIPPEPFLNN